MIVNFRSIVYRAVPARLKYQGQLYLVKYGSDQFTLLKLGVPCRGVLCRAMPSYQCKRSIIGFSTRSPGLSASENCFCLSLKYLWFGSYSPTTPMTNFQKVLNSAVMAQGGSSWALSLGTVYSKLFTPNFLNVSFCLENFIWLVIAFHWHCLIFTTSPI